jgi:hypothetical protein
MSKQVVASLGSMLINREVGIFHHVFVLLFDLFVYISVLRSGQFCSSCSLGHHSHNHSHYNVLLVIVAWIASH